MRLKLFFIKYEYESRPKFKFSTHLYPNIVFIKRIWQGACCVPCLVDNPQQTALVDQIPHFSPCYQFLLVLISFYTHKLLSKPGSLFFSLPVSYMASRLHRTWTMWSLKALSHWYSRLWGRVQFDWQARACLLQYGSRKSWAESGLSSHRTSQGWLTVVTSAAES